MIVVADDHSQFRREWIHHEIDSGFTDSDNNTNDEVKQDDNDPNIKKVKPNMEIERNKIIREVPSEMNGVPVHPDYSHHIDFLK